MAGGREGRFRSCRARGGPRRNPPTPYSNAERNDGSGSNETEKGAHVQGMYQGVPFIDLEAGTEEGMHTSEEKAEDVERAHTQKKEGKEGGHEEQGSIPVPIATMQLGIAEVGKLYCWYKVVRKEWVIKGFAPKIGDTIRVLFIREGQMLRMKALCGTIHREWPVSIEGSELQGTGLNVLSWYVNTMPQTEECQLAMEDDHEEE